ERRFRIVAGLMTRNGRQLARARAASGHAVAAPPSSVMKSRRFTFAVIRSPRRRARAASAARRGRAPWQLRGRKRAPSAKLADAPLALKSLAFSRFARTWTLPLLPLGFYYRGSKVQKAAES